MIPLSELETHLSARIYEPVVEKMFTAFSQSGCLEESHRLLSQLPDTTVRILIEVQATQVNKEKALWPIWITEKMGWNRNHAVKIGAAVDLLWSLSIVIDDLLDQDDQRADKLALWKDLGKEQTKALSFQALQLVLNYLSEEVNEPTGRLALEVVKQGVKSVAEHKHMGFDVDPSRVLMNYAVRDDFHSGFPINALATDGQTPLSKVEEMCLGLPLTPDQGKN